MFQAPVGAYSICPYGKPLPHRLGVFFVSIAGQVFGYVNNYCELYGNFLGGAAYSAYVKCITLA